MSKQEKLLELADRIDHEKLWRQPAMNRDKLTQDQRDRLDAGVMLRRYSDMLEPGRWLVIPPTGSVQFSAGTLDKAYEMAKRDDERKAATEAAKAASTEFKGWYCAHCQRGVDASEVTFHEQHTVCGRVITDDCPPAAKATSTAGELPPLPEMESVADMPHAQKVPPDWDGDYTNIWQKWQVAERNKMQWRAYALKLHAILTKTDAIQVSEAARQPAPVVAENEKDERDNEIFELQKALAFWLPQVNQFMSDEMCQRIAHDAYMLVIDGNLPDDFKTAQELGWILPATGKVQRDAEMVCGNCMEPIAATNRSQP